LIILSIYAIRFVILRVFMGGDILPQLFIAPRGLITILLFYNIPTEAIIPGFEPGILLFVIIGTSLIMTWAMIKDKRKMNSILDELDEEYEARSEAYEAIEDAEQAQETIDPSEPEEEAPPFA